MELTIYNALRQVVAEWVYDAIENKLSIAGLSSGIYSIQLKNGNQCAIQKFI
ncbi:MAG: T9SS type A sorting domain-containing protein [Sediminibacterium sp.]|nr:T9SS type A sorting domain-containing protein [Sediminibacterium sp.]